MISEETGEFSDEFLLWCRKLAHLSPQAWQRGFEQLELRVKEAARVGKEEWPPSYAEFLGYCEGAPGEIAHRHFTLPALPDKQAQERAAEAGAAELERMKKMF